VSHAFREAALAVRNDTNVTGLFGASRMGRLALSPLSTRSSAARDRAVHVLAEMRNDPSLLLGQAARLHGVKSKHRKEILRIGARKSTRAAASNEE